MPTPVPTPPATLATLRDRLLFHLSLRRALLWPDGTPDWVRPARSVEYVDDMPLPTGDPSVRRQLRLILNTMTQDMLPLLLRSHGYTVSEERRLCARIPVVDSLRTAARATDTLLEIMEVCHGPGANFPADRVDRVTAVANVVLTDYNGWPHHSGTVTEVAYYLADLFELSPRALEPALRKIVDGLPNTPVAQRR